MECEGGCWLLASGSRPRNDWPSRAAVPASPRRALRPVLKRTLWQGNRRTLGPVTYHTCEAEKDDSQVIRLAGERRHWVSVWTASPLSWEAPHLSSLYVPFSMERLSASVCRLHGEGHLLPGAGLCGADRSHENPISQSAVRRKALMVVPNVAGPPPLS